jgi:hypothetical protein
MALFAENSYLCYNVTIYPMKKIFWVFFILYLFVYSSMIAQSISPYGVTPAGKGKVNTRVDNIGYWQRMLKLGYVTANPNVPVPPAVFRGSRIQGKGIQTQDSPDVCVSSLLGTTQTENSIFISPENDNELLNSNNSSDWDGLTAVSLFGADDRLSEDDAVTWTGQIHGAGASNNGDPSTAIGTDGRWYVGKINGSFGQSVAWSIDQGTTWHDVTVATVPHPGSDLLDKNHLWIDNSPTSFFQGYLYDAWTNFANYSPNFNQIEVSRSADHGLTWSTPIEISSTDSAGSFCQGINIQTGPNGEVYGTFIIYDTWPSDETAIGFAKSLNGGTVFTPATRILSNIKGIRTTETNKNMRVNSFPCMAVDNSNGPHKGNIYIVWANRGVPGVNAGNDIDVYLIRSTDQGSSWSVPTRINQDPSGLGKEHFFPWISCDPATGNLCVVYYDDREVDSTSLETWISYSYNAGDTWTDMKVSDVSFTPIPVAGLAVRYFGDYIGLTCRNMMAYPVWTDNRWRNALTWVSPVNLGPAPNQPYVVYNTHILTTMGGDTSQNVNYADSLHMSLSLKNVGDQPANNVTAYISCTSPYIAITDSTAFYGDFATGDVKSVPNGYAFKVSDTIPDGLKIKINVRAVNSDTSWQSDFMLEAHAPALHIVNVLIHDTINGSNGHLEPGDSVDVVTTVTNTGDFSCPGTWVKISSPSDYFTFSVDSVFLDTVRPNITKTATFKLEVVPDACLYSSALLNFVAGSGLYRTTKSVIETIGIITEDWETDGFTKFPWTFSGTANWFIDTIHYAGKYSARSGVIVSNSSSKLQVIYTSGADDSISFYCKVSSEQDYDFLHFFIDNVPVGQWSGEVPWVRSAYFVPAGTHTFKWWYITDVSILEGSNAGWIDNIIFPSPPLPNVHAGNDTVICKGESIHLHGVVASYDSLRWTTFGDGVFSNDTILDPVYTPGTNDENAGKVKLRLKAWGSNGCYATSMHLSISDYPVAHIVALPNDTVCGGKVVHLVADSIPGGHYLWTPGGFTTPEINVDTALTGGFGSKWFKLRLSNSANCAITDSLKITFKDCTGISELTKGVLYEIYPNPNDGAFTITVHNERPGHLSIRVQNMLNQVMFEDKDLITNKDLLKKYRLNLPSGLYLLTIEDVQGNHNMKMMVR